MDVLGYSKTAPPPRRWCSVAGFWLATTSLVITLIYIAILRFKIRGGEVGVTFQLSVVLRGVPVLACILCLVGWTRPQRRLSLAGIALAVVSFAAILVMGSRFWP